MIQWDYFNYLFFILDNSSNQIEFSLSRHFEITLEFLVLSKFLQYRYTNMTDLVVTLIRRQMSLVALRSPRGARNHRLRITLRHNPVTPSRVRCTREEVSGRHIYSSFARHSTTARIDGGQKACTSCLVTFRAVSKGSRFTHVFIRDYAVQTRGCAPITSMYTHILLHTLLKLAHFLYNVYIAIRYACIIAYRKCTGLLCARTELDLLLRAKVEKIPRHLVIVLGLCDESVLDCVRIIGWCIALNIPYISFFDRNGKKRFGINLYISLCM